MSISSVIESGVVLNSVDASDTFEDIFFFVGRHVDSWGESQVLWDLTLFDFESTHTHSIASLVSRGALMSQKCSGLKTAVIVCSDLGFGMMRMFQSMAEEKIQIEFGVFRTKPDALAWLSGEEEI